MILNMMHVCLIRDQSLTFPEIDQNEKYLSGLLCCRISCQPINVLVTMNGNHPIIGDIDGDAYLGYTYPYKYLSKYPYHYCL